MSAPLGQHRKSSCLHTMRMNGKIEDEYASSDEMLVQSYPADCKG